MRLSVPLLLLLFTCLLCVTLLPPVSGTKVAPSLKGLGERKIDDLEDSWMADEVEDEGG